MNLKNTPKPWQICVEIAISFGLTVGIAEIAYLLWSAIGGGFKSFAVIVLMAIAFVIIAIYIDRIARKRDLVSPVYLDVLKGSWGILLVLFLVLAVDYTARQTRYLKDFKKRQAKKTEIVEFPSIEIDPLIFEDTVFHDYYDGKYSVPSNWGYFDKEEWDYAWLDISEYEAGVFEGVKGNNHIYVTIPDEPVILEWTSKRLKKFADWATGLNIPYCPVVYSRDQVCSYYYYAIGGEKLEIIKEDDEEYIPQYAIFLGIAVNTQKYFTIEELTWATGCGNTEKLSWRTIDKNTGKELTIKDIIKQKHLGLFYERMLAHLCNREGLFSSFYSEDFTVRSKVIRTQFDGIAIVPEGVVVYYHPYKIGCGAEGQYNSLIPYDELEGMLKCTIEQ